MLEARNLDFVTRQLLQLDANGQVAMSKADNFERIMFLISLQVIQKFYYFDTAKCSSIIYN